MKINRFKLLPVAAALLASGTASALDFHGYLRSGWGISSGNGPQQCFALPGAYSKYRLGNECETYSELNFGQNIYDGKDNVKFDYHVTLAYNVAYDNEASYESFVANNGSHSDIALRENWVEAKNIPELAGGTAWAGQRFYKRQDIHIIDFWFVDSSGTGAGIEDLPLGVGKFSYAVLNNSTPSNVANGVPYPDAVLRHDLRYDGVSLGDGNGELQFGLVINQPSSKNPGHDKGGTTVNVEHFIGNVLGGYNKFSVAYGEGGNQSLNPYPSVTTPTSVNTIRVAESLQWQTSNHFSGMADFIYQDTKNNYTWISIGARPIYHINKYFKLQLEVGHDEVKEASSNPDNGPTAHQRRTLDKITFAPTIVAGDGFWNRPELRVYYTYAKWNQAARDNWGGVAGGAGGVFGSATSGSSYGVQLESWW